MKYCFLSQGKKGWKEGICAARCTADERRLCLLCSEANSVHRFCRSLVDKKILHTWKMSCRSKIIVENKAIKTNPLELRGFPSSEWCLIMVYFAINLGNLVIGTFFASILGNLHNICFLLCSFKIILAK